MAKKIVAIAVMAVMALSVFAFTGCPKLTPTEIHSWQNKYSVTETGIIHEVRSIPSENKATLLWESNDVQLHLRFGLDNEYKDFYLAFNETELVCFAAYFYLPKDKRNNYYNHNYEDIDDYKKPTDAFFLSEISRSDFLSEKYMAKYGTDAGGIGRTNPPIYNKLNEPLKVVVSQEIFQKSEEQGDDGYGSFRFRFGIAPVFFSQENNKYSIFLGGENDGLTFWYSHKSDKITIGVIPAGGMV